ncbi:unnamed protein product [Amoebophrya sp. A120]|nr:unnamed protein product [Amoebophrya sp. A120]|eukprot:GSA120T00007729001.1
MQQPYHVTASAPDDKIDPWLVKQVTAATKKPFAFFENNDARKFREDEQPVYTLLDKPFPRDGASGTSTVGAAELKGGGPREKIAKKNSTSATSSVVSSTAAAGTRTTASVIPEAKFASSKMDSTSSKSGTAAVREPVTSNKAKFPPRVAQTPAAGAGAGTAPGMSTASSGRRKSSGAAVSATIQPAAAAPSGSSSSRSRTRPPGVPSLTSGIKNINGCSASASVSEKPKEITNVASCGSKNSLSASSGSAKMNQRGSRTASSKGSSAPHKQPDPATTTAVPPSSGRSATAGRSSSSAATSHRTKDATRGESTSAASVGSASATRSRASKGPPSSSSQPGSCAKKPDDRQQSRNRTAKLQEKENSKDASAAKNPNIEKRPLSPPLPAPADPAEPDDGSDLDEAITKLRLQNFQKKYMLLQQKRAEELNETIQLNENVRRAQQEASLLKQERVRKDSEICQLRLRQEMVEAKASKHKAELLRLAEAYERLQAEKKKVQDSLHELEQRSQERDALLLFYQVREREFTSTDAENLELKQQNQRLKEQIVFLSGLVLQSSDKENKQAQELYFRGDDFKWPGGMQEEEVSGEQKDD